MVYQFRFEEHLLGSGCDIERYFEQIAVFALSARMTPPALVPAKARAF